MPEASVMPQPCPDVSSFAARSPACRTARWWRPFAGGRSLWHCVLPLPEGPTAGQCFEAKNPPERRHDTMPKMGAATRTRRILFQSDRAFVLESRNGGVLVSAGETAASAQRKRGTRLVHRSRGGGGPKYNVTNSCCMFGQCFNGHKCTRSG